MTRLTDNQIEHLRADLQPGDWGVMSDDTVLALLAEVDALRAERDTAIERFDTAWADMRRIVAAGPEAERDAAAARAERAEATVQHQAMEAISALAEWEEEHHARLQAEARIAAALTQLDAGAPTSWSSAGHEAFEWLAIAIRSALSGKEAP